MSDILCKWLNEELRLSKAVEPKTFAKTFCSGYLIGEVLHKYQLQNDFSLFMKKDTSVSKLNNFTRLEPTLQLLGISFDINTAQELIQEKQGVATRLLYQLYVSLEKKKKAEISGTVMEIMQPAASAGLHKKGHEIYSDRLHRVVKRDAELKLQQIAEHYQEKIKKWNDQSVMTDPIQQRRQLKVQDDKRMKNIEKLGMYNQKHNGIINGNQAAIAQVPKPPPYTSQLNLKKRQRQKQRKEQQAQTMQTEITQFEMNRKKLVPYGVASSSSGQPISGEFPLGGSSSQGCEVPGNGTKLILQTSSKYIQDIRQRLEENAAAREQREKRRDRFLVEQLRAHEAQEEARREEHLVKRLTRQTQQEERLAAQLLHIRMQKEVIQDNRLFREQQYQQRRQRDFQEALEREAALAQQAKLEGAEEIRKELEFCNRIAAERAQSRYKKHFTSCKEIVEQIVDLSTKVGEYRLVTGNLIPEKAMRGWKELLLIGLPLYEPINDQQPGFEFSTLLDPVELEKQEILKNQDYDEYTNMVGEWAWLEEVEEAKLPLTNNNILGHVVCRLRSILHQPIIMKPSTPSFPHFTLKACVLGKFCSGKTTFMAKIAKAHGISVLSADTLIEEALNAFQNGELSARAMQGAAAEGELRKGNHISNELLVDIIVEAIRRVPAQTGWILDGFPVDICQAYLLEEALGGSVDVEDVVVSSRTNLAADPNPPKPPPPAVPVLDLALLLDIPDECVVRRAFTQTDADTADATTSHPTDRSLYLAQVPHRITAFQDTWPNLEKWFGEKLNILARVDADVDNEELCRRVESVLQQVMLQIQKAPVEDVELDSGQAPDSTSSGAPPPEDQPLALTGQDPGPDESDASLNEESVKSLSKSNTQSPREPSGMELTSSATNEDPTNTTESDSPLPGSSSWVYVDQPFPPDISEYLCPHWDAMCDSYVNSVKTVMQKLRSQCTVIDHHLYNIREEFRHYLGRPNLKQELVTQWQKDFNTIPDDMREDEETKAELHLRLDELCERLWDISEKRKEEDVQERAALGEGWIEEHSAVLINHHSVLMQVEFDRFQDTLYILKVYYLSMQTQVLPEIPSKFVCIPLLNKDPDERTEPTGTTVSSPADNGEYKRGTKFIPFLPRRPDASVEVPKAKDQIQTEPVKPSHEKLIADYVEALSAIRNLVSAELQQREAKEKKPDKERPKTSASKKGKEGKQSSKQKAPPSPPPSPEEKTPEQIREEELRNKIQQEYAAALVHEENSAKVHIALVKSHGLLMLDFLQSRAKQTFSSIQKWLEAQYLAEMKSIEHLSEVARHHIETSAKLQNELVLELNDFYLNGDCRMVASPPPPPRPPPSEKPTRSTLTITQLESLHQQLCAVGPTGLLFSSEFNSLLRDVISVNMGRNTLPDPWLEKNETQLLEIVSLLTDTFELIDWRRFLLSAALPWPFPSLTQLLVTLQRFKVADPEDSGYVNEEQYLHTKLWFSNESVQPVPEDPSEPIPYDRLANLHKFFFKLFADPSFSPSRLDYVSMLQYFAADPNPRQGFIRALSVVLGQHLKLPLTGHLVKSMPSLEDAIEVSPADLDGEYMEEDALCASSSLFREQEVSIPALLAVICHKAAKIKDHNPLPPGCLSEEEHAEHLLQIFEELGYNPEDCIPFSVLSQHPLIQSLMETTTHHQLVNIHRVLLVHLDEGGA